MTRSPDGEGASSRNQNGGSFSKAKGHGVALGSACSTASMRVKSAGFAQGVHIGFGAIGPPVSSSCSVEQFGQRRRSLPSHTPAEGFGLVAVLMRWTG